MLGPSRDTLVRRLAIILVKLNQGDRLDPPALAAEFGVNLRTIQRDLNERFAYLPLERVDGLYRLDPVFLGKLNTRDVERFASLAGVRGLFPSLSDDFLRDIFDSQTQAALLVRGHSYEDLRGKDQLFRQIERAIVARFFVSFDLQKVGEVKSYIDVEPYKLLNHKGIWYLAAKDGGKLKTFSFVKIERLLVSNATYQIDASVEGSLAGDEGIWLGEKKQEVILKVAADVASYFKRRKLIANQVIEKELEGGGLIISAIVGHANQILPIVRYWMPHIQIINPESLQMEMERELAKYLGR